MLLLHKEVKIELLIDCQLTIEFFQIYFLIFICSDNYHLLVDYRRIVHTAISACNWI